MPSVSVQDYLQMIYRLRGNESPVGTTALAAQLGVAPASVTGMMHKLHRQGLVEHEPYRGVMLTETGEREALRLLRRHRLWEVFLTQVLGLSWDEVHEEAHRLEHATSQRVADRLAAFLDYPEADPHGQPIPARNGTLPPRICGSLAEVEMGEIVQLVEVPDDDPALLRQLAAWGMVPGAQVTLLGTTPDGLLRFRAGGDERILSLDIAQIIQAEPA